MLSWGILTTSTTLMLVGRVAKRLMATGVRERAGAAGGAPGKVEAALRGALEGAFAPRYLQIVNESYKHSVPPGSESHFAVVIVADAFSEKSVLERHRAVNTACKDLLAGSIHALSVKASTPAQFEAAGGVLEHSTPNCLGGGKK